MTTAQQIKALKGIHPGIFLGSELKRQKRSREDIALAIGEPLQILEEITSGKRTLNKRLAKKIEKNLQISNGLLTALQLHYRMKKAGARHSRRKHTTRPDISKFRTSLFWDTRIESIRWNEQKLAVIKRIFERGNEQEKQEITRFYGTKVIEQALPKALIRS